MSKSLNLSRMNARKRRRYWKPVKCFHNWLYLGDDPPKRICTMCGEAEASAHNWPSAQHAEEMRYESR